MVVEAFESKASEEAAKLVICEEMFTNQKYMVLGSVSPFPCSDQEN
jgi:hypothetical protein